MSIINSAKIVTRILSHHMFGTRYPIHLILSMTNRCNLRCPYCFALYSANKKDTWTTKELFKLIDEAHELGCAYINLTGGEPLLRKDIREIIKHIVLDKGMSCSLSTNGSFVKKHLDSLKMLDSINISLDGTKEDHEANRGAKSFNHVLEAIDLLRRLSKKVFICTVLTKNNLGSIDYICTLAKQKGFQAIFHVPYGKVEIDQAYTCIFPSDAEYRTALRKIYEYKKRGYPIYYSVTTHRLVCEWPGSFAKMFYFKDEIPNDGFKYPKCYAGKLFCMIDANANMYPCTIMSGQYPTMNVIEHGFKKAWDNLHRIQRSHCQTCAYYFQTELNNLLSLKPEVMKNYFITSITR